MDVPLEGGNAVLPAPGTGLGGLGAYQAQPAGQAQFLAFQLPAVPVQYVHIKQAAQPVLVFNLTGKGLYGRRFSVQHVVLFVAGFGLNDLLIENGNPRLLKSRLQPPDAFPKAQMNQGGGLYRTGNVQGKKQQGFLVSGKKYLLGSGPAVPGCQHIRHFYRRSPVQNDKFFHIVTYSFLFLPLFRISSAKARA